MKHYIENLPKSTIATIMGAILVYSTSKGYIDGDLATLISTILIALGITVNISSGKFKK